MKKDILWQMAGMFFILILSGCTARTYTVVKDRVDQDLTTGNKGYIKGTAAQATQEKERKTIRTTYVTEIELPTFAKSPKAKAAKLAVAEEAMEEPSIETSTAQKSVKKVPTLAGNFKEYKVLKGDTLQKISEKFYGTTKKWTKIYEANKDKLSAPDKIYPGQIINIPVENIKK